jgi:hypothetical protein
VCRSSMRLMSAEDLAIRRHSHQVLKLNAGQLVGEKSMSMEVWRPFETKPMRDAHAKLC